MAPETFDQWYERTHPAHPDDNPATRMALRAVAEEGWDAAMAAVSEAEAVERATERRRSDGPWSSC